MTSATNAQETSGWRARVRAADVAAAAQVSISTVSLVVNHKWEGRVAAATVARVRAQVDRLGYVVDESARRLATGATTAVAVVTPVFTNPFYARVSLGAAAALGEAFHVVFSVPEIGDDPAATVDRLRGLRLAGALVAAPSIELLGRLALDVPTVLLDAPGTISGRPRVDLDVADGAAQLARHLVDLGHRRVAFMGATPETETFRVRRTALADELRRMGAALVHVVRLESEVDAGRAHLAALEAMPDVVALGATAVVCATDLHAYGLMRACAEIGIGVPKDLSVAGFDDQPFSAYVTPALTTVSLPADRLGREAGMMLAELIHRSISGTRDDGMDRSLTEQPTVHVLPVSLVVRSSTTVASASPLGSTSP